MPTMAETENLHRLHRLKVHHRAPEQQAALEKLAKSNPDALRVLESSGLLPTEFLSQQELDASRPRA